MEFKGRQSFLTLKEKKKKKKTTTATTTVARNKGIFLMVNIQQNLMTHFILLINARRLYPIWRSWCDFPYSPVSAPARPQWPRAPHNRWLCLRRGRKEGTGVWDILAWGVVYRCFIRGGRRFIRSSTQPMHREYVDLERQSVVIWLCIRISPLLIYGYLDNVHHCTESMLTSKGRVWLYGCVGGFPHVWYVVMWLCWIDI